METIIQRVDPERFADGELVQACRILRGGGLVAFPTETVYGLGGDALLAQASQKIYEAKGRPSDNPLIVHVADMEGVCDVALDISDKARALAEAFWPGPLTMIFKKAPMVPLSTTGGLATVAVRMPSHPVARALIQNAGVYIAAPSANLSGRPSPTRAAHVVEDLSGRVDMILDGGTVGIGIESTIVDMTGKIPVVLRPGYVTTQMLAETVGEVQIDPAVLAAAPEKDRVARAPGMKYRHYAPKGQMTIVEGELAAVAEKINALTAEREAQGKKAAVIATEESRQLYRCSEVYSIGTRKNLSSIAAGLYDVLRQMDVIGAEYIYTESFSTDALGQAIMNRMQKAAGYRKISV